MGRAFTTSIVSGSQIGRSLWDLFHPKEAFELLWVVERFHSGKDALVRSAIRLELGHRDLSAELKTVIAAYETSTLPWVHHGAKHKACGLHPHPKL